MHGFHYPASRSFQETTSIGRHVDTNIAMESFPLRNHYYTTQLWNV